MKSILFSLVLFFIVGCKTRNHHYDFEVGICYGAEYAIRYGHGYPSMAIREKMRAFYDSGADSLDWYNFWPKEKAQRFWDSINRELEAQYQREIDSFFKNKPK